MKNSFILFSLLLLNLFSIGEISAQKEGKISIEISSDTIGLNNTLEVAISIENAKIKRFNPPSFDGFSVQGPSTSTSMSIVNGDMTQSSTYTFYLTPREKGALKIGSISVDTEGGVLKTEEKEIVVLENFNPEIKPQKRQRSLWGDDPFFSRPTMPQQRVPEKTEKTKKKYTTEKI
jgi:hypothetical protein